MGNSHAVRSLVGVRAVHPHVHGELGPKVQTAPPVIGSSPRAWGTPYLHAQPRVVLRFIPTCMGNSLPGCLRWHRRPVHPHVHGELLTLQVGADSVTGSSPRAWGTPRVYCVPDEQDRFIPTCMGNSRRIVAGETIRTVHPHVHGELRNAEFHDPRTIGSSPRAWGTHGRYEGIHRRDRFIPTCMGNSVIA